MIKTYLVKIITFYDKKTELYKILGNLKEIFGFCDELDFIEDQTNKTMLNEFSSNESEKRDLMENIGCNCGKIYDNTLFDCDNEIPKNLETYLDLDTSPESMNQWIKLTS